MFWSVLAIIYTLYMFWPPLAIIRKFPNTIAKYFTCVCIGIFTINN